MPVSGGKNVAGRWNDCGGDKQQSWTAPAWITETEISLRGQEPEQAIRLLTVLENAE